MQVFTYSEARQRLAAVLEQADRDGAVRIRRRDGQVFILKPEVVERSPLDVGGVDLGMSVGEIIALVREGRERS